MLVGAFAHPEIWVYLWGPLELRRGLQQPLREDSGPFQPRTLGTEIALSSSLYHTLDIWGPCGRPQPPPALLKDFLLAVGGASSTPSPPLA